MGAGDTKWSCDADVRYHLRNEGEECLKGLFSFQVTLMRIAPCGVLQVSILLEQWPPVNEDKPYASENVGVAGNSMPHLPGT